KDRTVEVAREMGLTVLVHPENRGYGGNQKTCYREALARGADVVVMIHPDYQYDSRVIPHAVGFIELGICDVVLGSRIRSREEARSINFRRSVTCGLRTLTTVGTYWLDRLGVRRSPLFQKRQA